MTYVYLLIGFLLFVFVASLVYQIRLRRHRGMSRADFIQQFRSSGIPLDIPAAVYDYYAKSTAFRPMKVSPNDRYEDVFLEGEEDIEDDAKHLMKMLDIKHPDKLRGHMWAKPPDNLREMIIWLDGACRQIPKSEV